MSSHELTAEHYEELNTKFFCTSAVMAFMQCGRLYWKNIKRQATGMGVSAGHGNKGKKRPLDQNVYGPIKEFFVNIVNFAEVRATKSVRAITGLKTKGNEDGIVHLPPYFTVQNSYERYLDSLGYDMKTFNDGNYKVVHRGVGKLQPYVQLSTFYNIWKRDYGHIKVSRAAEDICEQCHRFAHRHNFMRHQSTLNSTADATLFTEDLLEDAEDPTIPPMEITSPLEETTMMTMLPFHRPRFRYHHLRQSPRCSPRRSPQLEK